MKLEVHFKNLDHSQDLAQWAEERLEKIPRLNIKLDSTMVTFYREGRSRCAEILVHCFEISFVAKARSNSFNKAFDQALSKVIKQLNRKKDKVQTYQPAEDFPKAS